MAFEKLNGIVLRYANYRDNDRILTVLTQERGAVAVTVRNCRKKSSVTADAVSEQCCYGEFVVYERCGILYASSTAIKESFYPIREDYEKLVSANQILRFAEIIAYNHGGAELFPLCYHALSFLAYGDNNPIDIELCSTAKMLCLAGYKPVLTHCVRCGQDLRKQKEVAFSKVQGGTLCDYCGVGCRVISALSAEALRRMILLPLPQMGRVKLPDNVRKELDLIIYEYAEYSFEQIIKVRGK